MSQRIAQRMTLPGSESGKQTSCGLALMRLPIICSLLPNCVHLFQHPSQCCSSAGKLLRHHSLCTQAGEYAYMSDPVNWHSEAGKKSKEKGGQPFKPAQLNSKGPFAKTPVRCKLDKGTQICKAYRKRLLVVWNLADEYFRQPNQSVSSLRSTVALSSYLPFQALQRLA